MRLSLWIAFLIRWLVTMVLLLLIAIDLGWVLPAMLFIMSVAIEILARQLAGLRRELQELRHMRNAMAVGSRPGPLSQGMQTMERTGVRQ